VIVAAIIKNLQGACLLLKSSMPPTLSIRKDAHVQAWICSTYTYAHKDTDCRPASWLNSCGIASLFFCMLVHSEGEYKAKASLHAPAFSEPAILGANQAYFSRRALGPEPDVAYRRTTRHIPPPNVFERWA